MLPRPTQQNRTKPSSSPPFTANATDPACEPADPCDKVPLTDKPAVYPYCLGRFDPRLARSHHRHRDTAQLCLCRRGQLAKISFDYHAGHIARQPQNATFLTLGLVKALCYLVTDEQVARR